MDEFQFDASSEADSAARSEASSVTGRPFLGIHFECCRTYGRVYRNEQKTEYRGQCPRCGMQVRVPIGKGGTSARFFRAG